MGRDNFIQWTRGLADDKNPGASDAFTLVKAQGGNEPPADGAKIKLEADKNGRIDNADLAYVAVRVLQAK
ncbi:hypothetical protein [Paenibacillus durus]|uniref:Uncharacterized protein n=1 Tax=Paenibacillus durus ATCC 35681 TaxID=1333534 RepID=A0A0F7CIK7_PAEDU|nr:hypothetical protein [Paenibacillus durus]AKG34720.1 hypothetical protein VK70_09155 [Paenibacillus durus ATCC 35681]